MINRKFLKISIAAFAVTVMSVGYYFKFEYHKDLNTLIKAAIDDRLPPNYGCSFEDITVTDDLLLLKKFNLIQYGTGTDTIISIRLDEFKVDQFNLSAFLTSNIIALDSILIKQPEIIIRALPEQDEMAQTSRSQLETPIKINKLIIEDGYIEY